MTERIFLNDSYIKDCSATLIHVDELGVKFDRTVFYPTGGGQPGDQGAIITENRVKIPIIDTINSKNSGDIIHILGKISATLIVGQKFQMEIDWARRYKLMRMHTCMHLLSSIIPYPVSGGKIGEEKSHLDFNIRDFKLDKTYISSKLNELIDSDYTVSSEWITEEELKSQPHLIKTMTVRPPRGSGRVRLIRVNKHDLQPCGGTHVQRTGEIGPVAVKNIQNKGSQNRRINITFLEN